MILAGLGGKNIFFICAGMMIMHWVIYTRVVRELTADGKMKNMVYAARMAGNKTPRIWIKYIFPIAAPAVLSMLALDFAGSEKRRPYLFPIRDLSFFQVSLSWESVLASI